jgi:hypothetical protein
MRIRVWSVPSLAPGAALLVLTPVLAHCCGSRRVVRPSSVFIHFAVHRTPCTAVLADPQLFAACGYRTLGLAGAQNGRHCHDIDPRGCILAAPARSRRTGRRGVRECAATGRTGAVEVGMKPLIANHVRLLPGVGPLCWALTEMVRDAGAAVAPASIRFLE